MSSPAQAPRGSGPDISVLAKEIEKGINSIGLRSQMLPHILIRVCETLSGGSADDVSFLMRDVVGEAMSLACGRSPMGPAALQAIGHAQAISLINRREARYRSAYVRDKAGFVTSQKLMTEHQQALVDWIETGVDPLDDPNEPSDLTRIGALIDSTAVRRGAMSVYVAAAQVLSSGLLTFTHSATPVSPATQPKI